MKSLGTLLVKHEWITKQQLGMAISKQREIGGRLGTCLLEMGAIAEDLLDRCLAEQQGVPVAAAESLAEVSDKVIQLLPAPIAIRYRAVPFGAGHSEVDMAMLEVDNLWLQDELSFIVGRRLNVFIANEARIVEALSTYYGAPLSERFAKLLDRLNTIRADRAAKAPHPDSRLVHSDTIPAMQQSSQEKAPTPSPTPVRSVPPVFAVPDAARRIDRPSSIPLSAEELIELGTTAPSGTTRPAHYSRNHHTTVVPIAEAAGAFLQEVESPQEVGEVLISALAQDFTRIMLFKATPTGIRGWLARGPGLNRQRFEEYRVTFDEASIFLNLREGGSFYLGHLPQMPAHLQLAECWDKDLSDECVMFPIRVRDRLVALAYGDRGPLGLADLKLERVRHLTSAAATALELCIVKQKSRKNKIKSGSEG